MREVDPFAYYQDQASVIPGFGGDKPAPAPGYAFHTNYISVRPGRAYYQLQLGGVRATRGKLSLRVHSLQPDTGENASFAAGARIDVAVSSKQDLCVSVPFGALRGTQYAFYGQLNDTDIQAEAIGVFIGEAEGHGDDYVEPPRSVLTSTLPETGPLADKSLFHVVDRHLFMPVSQDCTTTQIAELRTGEWSGQGIDDWAEALCLNALRAYDVTMPGLEGLLVGHCSEQFSSALASAGFCLRRQAGNPPPPERSEMFVDFLVWPEGLWAEESAESRWNAVKTWFARLKIGGVGIVTCRFRPGNARLEKNMASVDPQITQSEIERWALLLIADGYAVAPLAFSEPEVQQIDEHGLVRFALIARRI